MGTQTIKKISELRAVELLSRAAIFKSLTSEDKRRFAVTPNLFQHAKAGSNVIEQGDTDACIYIVMAGAAKIIKDDVHVADIEAGQFVGEVAFITGEPRTATVQAESDMILLRITTGNFANIPIRAREIMKDKIIGGLEQRIADMNEIIKKYRAQENQKETTEQPTE
ncbi:MULTISPECIES: cyclic nucleotide-binding domain-containing protein [Gammaproteobacteria]|uniref:cyclic nucleotide-binding domain-containing protein n=1 Tax=Gammaproteobacteria TaxID=1236 RepID=UPI000DD063D2|nr:MULTISPECIES: cyclic nucleotide-binding domain-containing protein [Gammaproteobacteria]RTE87357.1 cyclic nucleotide-binding domain-containing protein [Aliidiomarina sp. B3213]TCZ92857.1 cyclic nucleotide-binding domain-containing protein [Lysobacter sp. N42]